MAKLEIRVHNFMFPALAEGQEYGMIAEGDVVELVNLGNKIEPALSGRSSENTPRMRIVDDEGNELGAWF